MSNVQKTIDEDESYEEESDEEELDVVQPLLEF